MDHYDKVSGYISELVSRGYSSLAREEGQDNLKAFKEINSGLVHLKNTTTVQSDDILKCVILLRLLVDLRENIIRSDKVLDSQIPNIYKSVDHLNDLLVKSADQSMKDEDHQLITIQCEEFLKAADEIRKDVKLKGLGILDGKLKNVIGRLRKKASIDSVFKDEQFDVYNKIISRADEILAGDNLQEIGEKLQELNQTVEKLENNFTYGKRLLSYCRRYEQAFIKKIKSRMNDLYKKNIKMTLFDCQEMMNTFLSIENLITYHENKGLNISIRQLKNKIEKNRIEPVLENLAAMKDFVLSAYQKPFWQDYETLYLNKHQENEIFSDTFYEYTLKGLTPDEASTLLKEKIQALKQLSLKELKYVSFEQEFEAMLSSLLRAFKGLPVGKDKPGTKIRQSAR